MPCPVSHGDNHELRKPNRRKVLASNRRCTSETQAPISLGERSECDSDRNAIGCGAPTGCRCHAQALIGKQYILDLGGFLAMLVQPRPSYYSSTGGCASLMDGSGVVVHPCRGSTENFVFRRIASVRCRQGTACWAKCILTTGYLQKMIALEPNCGVA
ncbi:hypothetical protein BS50DRAFT_54416 [Corynespora cassiicola Philippines]|uniref:Uncharacterized protein n=1 Tax=Corynespora cassiicola Philippines TaxID=1448308 RepID=A0A2T2NIL9_CORCC|nr:hypothetical protein BS50DRAFT_54416 [Corynespora cassiicola Philippines]